MSHTKFKDVHTNSEFDLDAYLEEKAGEEVFEQPRAIKEEPPSSFKRNAIAVGIFMGAVAMWGAVFGPPGFFGFGASDTNTVTTINPPLFPQIDVPKAPLPPAPPLPPATNYPEVQSGYLDYLQQFNEQNLSMFSGSAIQAFYNSGVPIQYLKDLEGAGLINDFSYSAIIGLYTSNVSIDYLQMMQQSGFLNDFSYSAIIGLYSSNVSIDYLQMMQQSGFLNDFSYSGIIGLYSSNVSIDYLQNMQQAGFLNDFSYSGIIGLYSSNVPVSFLQELEDRGLISDMSYSEIISAYFADN